MHFLREEIPHDFGILGQSVNCYAVSISVLIHYLPLGMGGRPSVVWGQLKVSTHTYPFSSGGSRISSGGDPLECGTDTAYQ